MISVVWVLLAASPRVVAVPQATFTGPKELASIVNETIAERVRAHSGEAKLAVAADVVAALGQERQRQLLGCEESENCMAEVAQAMNADEMVTSSVNLVSAGITGNAWTVSVTRVGRAADRLGSASTSLCGDTMVLTAALRRVVDAAFGVGVVDAGHGCPPTAAAATLGVGVALTIAGAVGVGVGLVTKARFDAQQSGGAITVSRTDAQVAQLAFTSGLVGAALGLVTSVVSVYFLAREPKPERIALLPLANTGLLALPGWWAP